MSYLKSLAIRAVNFIVDELHTHAAIIAQRSPQALARFKLSRFWNQYGFVTTQNLAPLVLTGLDEKPFDPPNLLEDGSYELLYNERVFKITCNPSTISVVVREGEMTGEHSVNPYIVLAYLRKMHTFTLALPSPLTMVGKAVRALERKSTRTRKEERKLQELKQMFRKLYGEATQAQREYCDNVGLRGQIIYSTEAREYLCGRIQYLRELPNEELLGMYTRELESYDNDANSTPPPLGEPSSYLR